MHPCICVIDWRECVSDDVRRAVGPYAEVDPLGKKLAVVMSLQSQMRTVYFDSDVLFFPPASSLAAEFAAEPRYMADCHRSLDDRLLLDAAEAEPTVNGGFLMWSKPPDWAAALARYATVRDSPSHFTEQTVVHLAIRASGGIPLNPTEYVLIVDDQFQYRDVVDLMPGVALRHYVGPVRHKLWNMIRRMKLDR
jgi:hypothetical protein